MISSIKEWIVTGAIVSALVVAAPLLRRKWREMITSAIKRVFVYLFIEFPKQIDYGNIPEDRKADAQACVRAIVYNMVRLEEMLIPDNGMGEVKKKNVVAKLSELGINEKIGVCVADFIDDAVQIMNTEATLALEQNKEKEEDPTMTLASPIQGAKDKDKEKDKEKDKDAK